MSPAELTGRRVLLRRPHIEDAHAMFDAFAADPRVTRYLSWRPHPDVTETRRVIDEFYNVGDHTAWLIADRRSAPVLGVCGWTRRDPDTVELGYCLGRRWWGRGLMSETVAVLLDEIRRDDTVRRVSAQCHADNAASAAVLRRCGMEFEGRLVRVGGFPNLAGESHDVLRFGLTVR